ncbi:MAG: MBL fold metallo-hydrolase [Clostridiales bacterium]|nr:MBL fold metallo-hydrolase [Clostridiales bacterium]
MLDLIKKFESPTIASNIYLIRDAATKKYAMIDCGGVCKEMDAYIAENNAEVEYILLTHGHFDHICAAEHYRNKYGARIVISEEEEEFTSNNTLNLSNLFGCEMNPFKPDLLLKDGQTIMVGESEITFKLTPGHTIGSGCYFCDGNVIFTGDTMFSMGFGRTDLPTGDPSQLQNSLEMLYKYKGYTIYPGHGERTVIC